MFKYLRNGVFSLALSATTLLSVSELSAAPRKSYGSKSYSTESHSNETIFQRKPLTQGMDTPAKSMVVLKRK